MRARLWKELPSILEKKFANHRLILGNLKRGHDFHETKISGHWSSTPKHKSIENNGETRGPTRTQAFGRDMKRVTECRIKKLRNNLDRVRSVTGLRAL
mmetsp:Transcript_51716/g.60417  ORF Transcript_51716/g.60417 Transcript_51716/m.60417 type:complete len:98 (-) Transcript_51716:1425-1718(-)